MALAVGRGPGAPTPELSARTRARTLDGLAAEAVDVLVVGGGITGTGIAREAAARGLTVALVERGDLACGTSSKSSKLLHGGLRYVEQFEFHLVFEALAARNRLFASVPHLAREIPFVFPVYRRNRDSLTVVDLGLYVYDLFSSLSQFRLRRLHRRLSARALAVAEPGLSREGLRGAVRYTDGLTEDARLTAQVALDAVVRGAQLATYTEVAALQLEGGRVVGARLRDRLTGREIGVLAGCVVNAAGPWVDAIRRLEDPEVTPLLRPTKGVHVVVRGLTRDDAVVIKSRQLHAGKRRWMFVIPYGDHALIGTTDTDAPTGEAAFLDEDSDATPEEVAYLLDSVNDAFPEAKLTPADVISSFAGWRPLIAPRQAGRGPSDVSREHAILESPGGLVSIAGGKLTTFAPMAAEVVDRVVARWPQRRWPDRPHLDRVPLAGATLSGPSLEAHADAAVARHPDVDPAVVRHLASTYAGRVDEVVALLREDPGLARPLEGLAGGALRLAVEPVYAVRHELAVHLADFLMRRTRLHLLDADQGLGCAPDVARLMGGALAHLLHWPDERRDAWVDEQVAAYRAEVERERTRRGRG